MHAFDDISLTSANVDIIKMSPYVDIVLVRTPRELGAAARAARRRRRLTQADLATRIGATRAWVSSFEGGKPTVELGLVLRALAAVDLTIDLTPAEPHRGIDLDELLGPDDA